MLAYEARLALCVKRFLPPESSLESGRRKAKVHNFAVRVQVEEDAAKKELARRNASSFLPLI